MEKTFGQCKSIDGINDELSKYLYSLLISITNVDVSYIHYNGANRDDDYEHVERVFAYELYRQWCDCPFIHNNKRLIVNAEIPKYLIHDVRVEDKSLTYPDLVLHEGQNDYKGNLIICEIKRASYARQHPEKLLEDFNKLCKYLSKDFKAKVDTQNWEPFQIGVFIMTDDCKDVSLSVKNIITLLGDNAKEVNGFKAQIKKRIFCIAYNGKTLKFDTLYNIIKKANN